ncbi:MlaD family protein [Mycobacterium branderi]|uniref:Mammalian cell entry protein n=1 Tax=Mycobacterium branderi TaxID=43348 RepID=A0A7I7W0A6_9MYCO|nr:MlaD family protein [Mycobacterium branderi]MCV7232956.1 MCE family protein [Mycobacterium branderi]ORA41071.1 mammalian cell entry protein [Mycobacterium branderi]BBZ10061.1 putative Mce family protein [Mycobacterium branderi]
MMKHFGAVWKFGLAIVVSGMLLILISNEIRQPVAGETRSFTAEFTDVSGLHEGADVRVRGVRVGKVQSLALNRSNGRTLSRVQFTMQRRYSIVPTSRLAVKFQALTGLRYIDVIDPAEGAVSDEMASIPTSMTIPSFDITKLFNGLQPVLATLDPSEINTFTENVATFLAGDGNGLGPMLASIKRLTALVSDREAVIATLMRNLQRVAEGVRGKSDALPTILDQVRINVDAAMTVLDEFRKSQVYGPEFTGQVARLLDALGLNSGEWTAPNYKPGWDPAKALDKAFTNVYNEIDGIKRIPVVWENIPEPTAAGTPVPCSKGPAVLPLPMDVLLNGRKVVICRQ